VLVGSFADLSQNEVVQGFRQVLDTLNDPIDQKFAWEFQQGTLANPVPETFLDLVVQESLKVPSRVWKSVASALFSSNYTADLKKVTAPALVLWGDKDLFSPYKDQKVLAGALQRSRLLVYNGVGHALHWEEPEQFARDLIAFVEPL
jgi:pimeloyl-ACP methyl ester carboxylesterase